MTKKSILLFFIILTVSPFSLSARPATPQRFTVTQPDGSTFYAYLRGDEFAHIMVTEDGCAVIQDADGWYSYAIFEADGSRHSSGHHVGRQAPLPILDIARQIPSSALEEQALRMRAQRTIRPRNNLFAPATKAPLIRRGLILLVEFSDLKFTYTKEDFEKLVHGSGNTVEQYFYDQFNGEIEFEFDIAGIFTLSKEYAYYGGNDDDGYDKHPDEMTAEACKMAAEAGVDFSKYALIKPDVIDFVFVFFAGGDEADGAGNNHIWSHFWTALGQNVVLNGKRLDDYACASELSLDSGKYHMTGIGTFCHEFSHILGLKDLYDTDYNSHGGQSNGLWHTTALMDGGNFNNIGQTPPYYNAVDRWFFHQNDIPPLKPGTYTLQPIHINGDCYRVDTDQENEFFLIECRSNEGWDKYIGGSGLLIYHIDYSDRTVPAAGKSAKALWDNNEVNCYYKHECADLVEATPGMVCFQNGHFQNNLIPKVFYPCGSINSFTPETNPAFKSWNGVDSPVAIANIKKNADGSVSFLVVNGGIILPTVENCEKSIFQDAVILNWETSLTDFDGQAVVEWGLPGEKKQSRTVKSYGEGKFATVLEGLTPASPYSVNIRFVLDDFEGETASVDFMTKSVFENAIPYIWLNVQGRNRTGTFAAGSELPLRVYNATDATRVVWSFKGETVTPGVNGWWAIPGAGELKAVVEYKDGTHETLVKSLVVK